MDTTPVTLLQRLGQPNNDADWARFVELYSPLLFAWTRRLGLQSPDASDLIQDLFLFLYKHLPRFVYKPGKSFRGWLRTVLTNRWREWRSKRSPQPLGDGLPPEPQADSFAEFEEAEYRRFLLRQVLRMVELEFPQTTWKAFQAYVLENRPASEVADVLKISTNSVYIAKTRVLKRLRQELGGLLD